MYINKQTHFNN